MRARVATAACLLLALLALGAPSPAAGSGDNADSIPEAGSCHNLTTSQVYAESDARAPVDCTQRHNLMTVKVFTLRGDVDWDDDEAIRQQYFRPCRLALNRALDATDNRRGLSAYDMAVFYPTQAQRRAGHRWVRCDATLPTTRGFAPLPRSASIALGHHGRLDDSIASCLGGRPLRATTCALPHRYRAVTTVNIRGRFPHARQMRKLGETCAKRHGRDALYSNLSRERFRTGDHVLICYDANRS